MPTRPKIPPQIETEVLVKSGRRCAICFALHGDDAVKQGQIAHLDQDRENNRVENLCYLCLAHHDEYDTQTSQSKGLTEQEVKSYRKSLYVALPAFLREKGAGGDVSVAANVSAGSGEFGQGGNVRIEGGVGRSGGNVAIGPGEYRAGAGGPGGKGGDLTIKGGDAV